MATATETAPDIIQAERELTTLAQAIASLYDVPMTGTESCLRAELDQRLAAAQARVLALRLIRSDQAYAEATRDLGQAREELATAEMALRQARDRLAAARERVGQLETQERRLRARRHDLERALAACDVPVRVGRSGAVRVCA